MSSEPRRLARAAILVDSVRALRELTIPAVIGLVVAVSGSGSPGAALLRGAAVGVLATLVAALSGWVTWRTTVYWVAGGAVWLRRGILRVREKSVALERIQSVDTVQGPLQRMLGVLELRVQAAGGERGPEITLGAVTPEEAGALRRELEARPAPAHAAEEAGEGPVRTLGTRRLLAAAVTTPQLGVILPIAVAASQIAQRMLSEQAEGMRLPLPDPGPVEVAAVAAGAIVLAWTLVIAGAVIAFASFTVARQGERLVITRGALARRRATVPVARVHAVTVVEGLLREPFGLCQVRVETAGYAGEPAAARTLFPLLARDEVPAFLGELLPELSDPLDELAAPPARARRRFLVAPAAAAVAATAALALLVPAAALAGLVLVPASVALGWSRYRATGWRLGDGRLVLRARGLARRTAVITAERVQERSLRQNPFQRRADLATLEVAVGSGSRFAASHLEAATVLGILARLRPDGFAAPRSAAWRSGPGQVPGVGPPAGGGSPGSGPPGGPA